MGTIVEKDPRTKLQFGEITVNMREIILMCLVKDKNKVLNGALIYFWKVN